jgi:hypothetical protein
MSALSTPPALRIPNLLLHSEESRPKRFFLRIPQFEITNSIVPVKMSAERIPI